MAGPPARPSAVDLVDGGAKLVTDEPRHGDEVRTQMLVERNEAPSETVVISPVRHTALSPVPRECLGEGPRRLPIRSPTL